MNEITPNVSRTAAASRAQAAQQAAEGRSAAPPAASPAPTRADQVELSDRARLLSQLRESPDVRRELVDRVRGEIENGQYLTPDKLDRAADNLLGDLDLLG